MMVQSLFFLHSGFYIAAWTSAQFFVRFDGRIISLSQPFSGAKVAAQFTWISFEGDFLLFAKVNRHEKPTT